jgi:hypothetical protein
MPFSARSSGRFCLLISFLSPTGFAELIVVLKVVTRRVPMTDRGPGWFWVRFRASAVCTTAIEAESITIPMKIARIAASQLTSDAVRAGARRSAMLTSRHWADVCAYSSLNVAVATTNMATAAVAVIWFCTKLRQVGEGALRRIGAAHPTDQGPDFGARLGASGTA